MHNNIESQCPLLKMGSSGASVKRLQSKLVAAGFNPGKIDGIFGSLTRSAVVAFQRSAGLVQDGIVGVKTWTALGVNCGTPTPPVNRCPTLRQGSTGPAVRNLQGLLKTRGFYTGNIDGIFGPLTRSAVIAFQRSAGLVQDGIVGIRTWTALGVDCGITPPPPPPPERCPTLRQGSTGPAVRNLQGLLKTRGFYTGNIDGIFGPLTRSAVIAFQRSAGLVQDGIVGIRTWTALGVDCGITPPPPPPPVDRCPTLQQGSTGPAVRNLQGLLKTRGFYTGNIDGIFGPLTRSAVIAFQRSTGLVQDGIVGIRTWTALGVDCGITPPPPPPPDRCPTLQQGSTGPAVVNLQGLLQARGFYMGNIDGIFGQLTKVGVINFQGCMGLVQDGIVGIKTWTALGVNCF